MSEELQRVLRAVREKLLQEPVSPRVEDPADINRHYCRYVAETVVDRVDDELDARILEDGGRGYVHTWIACEGRHYDAECVEGSPTTTTSPSSSATRRQQSTSSRGRSTRRRSETGAASRSIRTCNPTRPDCVRAGFGPECPAASPASEWVLRPACA